MKSITPKELYDSVGIKPAATLPWGEKIPSQSSGVYVISVENVGAITTFIDPFEEIERGNWNDDQEIIYIGRATVLSKRLQQFYKHKYGQPSPHKGGQAILLLQYPKLITWAEVDDFAGAEDRLIKAFQKHAGRMPFGNRRGSAKMKGPRNRSVDGEDDIRP